MAIVYQHRRNDTNEVFYVGIGKSEKRAYTKHGRSEFWHSIADSAGYIVEILSEKMSWNDACLQEGVLIMAYGRRDLGLGTLVNMTNGGEGTLGRLYNNQDLEKMSQRMKGPNNHMYGKSGEAHNRYGKHHSDCVRQRISEAVKGEKNARYGKPNTLLSNRNENIIRGSVWVTNGVDEVRLQKNETIPFGYIKGRNTMWITDGITNKKFSKNETLPVGFRKGRIIKNNNK